MHYTLSALLVHQASKLLKDYYVSLGTGGYGIRSCYLTLMMLHTK